MAYVELSHVSFGHAGGPWILSDISLRFERGVTAIVGENGAGKSTLLSLVAGTLTPSSGTLRRVPGELGVALCPQDAAQLSEVEQRFFKASDRAAQRLKGLLHIESLVPARWHTFSAGERRRVQLAAALHAEPELILLDEPTNHVDVETRERIAQALSGYPGIALLVSHDRALIDALAHRTVRLHRGCARVTEGGYAAARAVWDAEEARARDERDGLVRQARAAAARLECARQASDATERGRSAKARMRNPNDRDGRGMGQKTRAAWAEAQASRTVSVRRKQADDRARALGDVRVDKALGGRVYARFSPCPRPVLVSIERDAVWRGEKRVLVDLRLSVPRDLSARIEGPNGAGKSTLLEELYLALPAKDRARVTYLRQELSANEAMAVLEQVRTLPREEKGRVLDLVAALGLDPKRLLASPCPSPGEAKKLTLALGLGTDAWGLFLDEPTNHLDLPAIERLELALAGYPGALLLVTHDQTFLADRVSQTYRVHAGRVQLA
jgi:ATPase subunit of ABC transporter with duplicated ATPase domains